MFLLKKLVSIFLSLCFCLCLFTPVCFADDSVYDHTHNWVKEKIHSYSLDYNGVAFGIDVFKCSECALYLHTLKFLGYEVPVIRASPDTALGSEAAAMCAQAMVAVFGKEWYATKFEAGGGSASPGGVGRNPSGYSGQGMPTVNSSGVMFLSVPFEGYYPYSGYGSLEGTWVSDETYNNYINCSNFFKKSYYAGSLGSDDSPGNAYLFYTFTVPVDGVYYFGKYLNGYEYRHVIYYFKSGESGVVENKFNYSDNVTYYQAKHLKKGDVVHFQFTTDVRSEKTYIDHVNKNDYITLGKFWFYSALVCFEPDPDSSTLNNKSNITINNNTWNGNIYVDSSNKLTYIYPQYTTVNENNETVTNISNNPIIYNEKTKQYYTYDQTTNNYYYITYGDPAPTPTPTPTPSPSPDPGGSGGGSSGGDGSGGGSGDTPSGGGSSWWEKLLDKLGSALIDGLLDAIKGILKLLFDLFSSILGWIIWLCSKVFDLFPFLPPGVGALLVGGVVVCFILAFIKFIRG